MNQLSKINNFIIIINTSFLINNMQFYSHPEWLQQKTFLSAQDMMLFDYFSTCIFYTSHWIEIKYSLACDIYKIESQSK